MEEEKQMLQDLSEATSQPKAHFLGSLWALEDVPTSKFEKREGVIQVLI